MRVFSDYFDHSSLRCNLRKRLTEGQLASLVRAVIVLILDAVVFVELLGYTKNHLIVVDPRVGRSWEDKLFFPEHGFGERSITVCRVKVVWGVVSDSGVSAVDIAITAHQGVVRPLWRLRSEPMLDIVQDQPSGNNGPLNRVISPLVVHPRFLAIACSKRVPVASDFALQ